MKQVVLELNLKKTHKREFMEQMELVVAWAALVERIAPYYPARAHRQATLLIGDDAARLFHAAMVLAG